MCTVHVLHVHVQHAHAHAHAHVVPVVPSPAFTTSPGRPSERRCDSGHAPWFEKPSHRAAPYLLSYASTTASKPPALSIAPGSFEPTSLSASRNRETGHRSSEVFDSVEPCSAPADPSRAGATESALAATSIDMCRERWGCLFGWAAVRNDKEPCSEGRRLFMSFCSFAKEQLLTTRFPSRITPKLDSRSPSATRTHAHVIPTSSS